MFTAKWRNLLYVISIILGLNVGVFTSDAVAARKTKKSLQKISGDTSSEYSVDTPMIKQTTPPKGDVELTAFAGTGFVDIGAGLNVSVRIIDHGFIQSINNSVAIEGGYYYDQSTTSIFGLEYATHSFGGGPRWQFHVSRAFTAFAGIDIGMERRTVTYTNDYLYLEERESSSNGIDWGSILGANWHFSNAMALKLFHNTFYGSTNVGLAMKI
jgi:hypothetical protein